MLGRYIAGTLLILGAAMMVAPDSPEKNESMVTRSETSPAALVTAEPAAMAVALEKSPEPVVATTAASSKNIEAGVEAALIQALALDAAEDAAEPSLEAATAEPTEGSLTVNLAEAAPVVPESQPETTLADPEPRKLYVTGTRVNRAAA